MQTTLALVKKTYCYACGLPATHGALVCPACGGAAWVTGAVLPTEVRPERDGYPLPWPWVALGSWPSSSVVAVSGGPGSGKSTLAAALHPRAWLTSEQTPYQVGSMFHRLRVPAPTTYATHDAGDVARALDDTATGLVVVDSLTQLGGWDAQAAILERVIAWARSGWDRRALVVLQVNARGEGAGLMELPHLVDAVCTVGAVGQGLRAFAVSKNRHGPLSTRLYQLGAHGVRAPDDVAGLAAYSVEGEPGSYTLHPFPMPGAKWSGLWKVRVPEAGAASACVVAGYCPGGLLHPADAAERRAFAEAHGLRWVDTLEDGADGM